MNVFIMEPAQVIPARLYQAAQEIIAKYNIDNSHGMTHLEKVLSYAMEMYSEVAPLTHLAPDVEEDTVRTAAFVHDLIDGKYMNEAEGLTHLCAVLEECKYTAEQIECIVFIITHMSWSVRHERLKTGLPMIPEGPWTRATMFVADCDMLDGFNPWRCKEYNEKKFGLPEDDPLCTGWRRTVLQERVLRYIDTYMYFDCAKARARPMHDEVEEHIATYLANAPLYKYL